MAGKNLDELSLEPGKLITSTLGTDRIYLIRSPFGSTGDRVISIADILSGKFPNLIFVSPGGSNTTGNGTVLAPYQTVQFAMSTITASATKYTIMVQAGAGYTIGTLVTKPNVSICSFNSGELETTLVGNIVLDSSFDTLNSIASFIGFTLSGSINFDASAINPARVIAASFIHWNLSATSPSSFKSNFGGAGRMSCKITDSQLSGNITFSNMSLGDDDAEPLSYFIENSRFLGSTVTVDQSPGVTVDTGLYISGCVMHGTTAFSVSSDGTSTSLLQMSACENYSNIIIQDAKSKFKYDSVSYPVTPGSVTNNNGGSVTSLTTDQTISVVHSAVNYTPTTPATGLPSSLDNDIAGLDNKTATTAKAVMIGPTSATAPFSSSNIILATGQVVGGDTGNAPLPTTLIGGNGIDIDTSSPGDMIFNATGGGLEWRPVNTPGNKTLTPSEGLIANTVAPTSFIFDSTPAAYPVGCSFGISSGTSPGWTITVPSGVTIHSGNLTYTGPTVITNNSSFDLLTFVCLVQDTVFTVEASDNSKFIGSGYSPINYTPTDNSTAGNLEGIDNALGAITTNAFNWQNKTAPGTYTLISTEGFIANTAATLDTALPATAAINEYYAIGSGSAPGWSISIGAGQILNVGPGNYIGPAVFSSNASTDSIFIVCTATDTIFRAYNQNTAAFIRSAYVPTHYTDSGLVINTALQGIDNALTNVATIYRDAYVDVGRGIDGVGGNGSQLYPYRTPAYAMSQITPSASNRYNLNILSGIYDGADGTFALKPFTSVTCENANTTHFTNSSITLDSSWLNTDADASITNLNVVSGSGIDFNTTTFGTATIQIYLNNLFSQAPLNYAGRNIGKDSLYLYPTNVSGNITMDSGLLFSFIGVVSGALTLTATTGISQVVFAGTAAVNTITVQSTTFSATLVLADGAAVGAVIADGSSAILRIAAGMTPIAGYSAINGATVNFLTSGTIINGSFTPTYYTPVDPSVTGHLEGIDNKFQSVATQIFTWYPIPPMGTNTLIKNFGFFSNAAAATLTTALPATANEGDYFAVSCGQASSFDLDILSGQTLEIGETTYTGPVTYTSESDQETLFIYCYDNNTKFRVYERYPVTDTSGFTWNLLTGSPGATTLANNNGYIVNTDITANFVVPATATINFISAIRGNTGPGWRVSNNSGQNIQLGTANSGIGDGSLFSSTKPSDGTFVGCDLADLNFVLYNTQGNLEVSSSLEPDDFSSLGLLGFYDANHVNDSSPPSDGDPIPTWVDLSPAGNDLVQATGSDQPTYKELQQNTLSGVLADGVSQFMLNSTIANTSSSFYLFQVIRVVSNSSVCQGMASVYDNSQSNDYDNLESMSTSYCPPLNMLRAGFVSGTEQFVWSDISLGNSFVFANVWNGANVYGELTQQVSQKLTSAGAAFNQDRLIVFARHTGGTTTTFGNNMMHMLIVGNGSLTEFQVKGICSALSNIWGIPQ